MFGRLGSFCFRRRRLVVALWFASLIAFGALSGAVGTAFQDEFNLPNVESKTGFDILEEHFGGQGTGVTGTIVFRTEQGVNDPAVRRAMEDLFAKVDAREDVTVASPYVPGGERQIAAAPSPDAGKIAFADLEMPANTDFKDAAAVAKEIQAEASDIAGVQVEIGGAAFTEFAA
ncbi:MAG: MMPL family transporter, partial [Actinomycetota bacterium]|nr:MMPL family transporter [Actinomycetota bacterium]